ncbi:hypothetical protein [Acidovorax sp. NCPPB 4044]|uniref:hypothetical protein n=1 Tax=Acidovorax sp. NCPPB 4044 TaxID=2940490 RepID=UPI0023048642|nr:hypothetical protein [Acidovorax sp. NCPPB 4044]MDA8520131.1 hypothetical protein [Acidovorax sp. NCPPB 4044]
MPRRIRSAALPLGTSTLSKHRAQHHRCEGVKDRRRMAMTSLVGMGRSPRA